MARRIDLRSLRVLRLLLLAASMAHGGQVLAQSGASAPVPPTVAEEPASAGNRAPSELDRLRADLQAQRELVRQMRQRQSDADVASHWLPWVGLGLVLALGLAGWLGLRLVQVQRSGLSRRSPATSTGASAFDAAAARQRPVAAPVAAAPATGHAGLAPMDAGAALFPGSSRGPALGAPTTTAGAMGAYQPEPATLTRPAVAPPQRLSLPLSASADLSLTGHEPRDVTVEELLDLEQQVDFFMVLGQEDAAIDLLVGHIRSTGGTSALPYLKLLEVYRQQGQEDAYERTRSRFNLRFNAYAPEWSADFEAGRLLEDYADIVERIQRAWPAPLDAMAELDALLFRRQQGELFDLPAYRELLMLYAVSRDLDSQAPVSPVQVDVLLPLDDDLNEQDTTSPRPHLGLFSDDALGGRTAEWARINERNNERTNERGAERTVALRSGELAPPRIDLDMALDIDLSEFTPPPREFTQPAAFNDVDLSSSDFAAFDDEPPQRPTTPTRRN